MHEIIENENNTLNYTPEGEEIIAGIDEFNKFGVMNKLRSLTGGDVTKVEAVLEQPYNVNLIWLQMNLAESIYQRRLRKVYENKK